MNYYVNTTSTTNTSSSLWNVSPVYYQPAAYVSAPAWPAVAPGIAAPEPRELTHREWLRAEVESVCKLARLR